MTKEEKLRYLNEVIYALKAAGIIRKQSDLANLMGIYPTSQSCAKAGREDYLTDTFVRRLKDLMEKYPDIVLPSEEAKRKQQGVFIPLETLSLYNSMAASIDRLTRLLEDEKRRTTKGA